MERLLWHAFEAGLIIDAAVAQNDAQRAAFWKVREEQSAAQKPEGGGWKHDVSVPVSRIADFLEEATAAVERFHPGARVSAFGHVGDGNLHINVMKPEAMDKGEFHKKTKEADRDLFGIVKKHGGSISAEHGIGLLKKPFLDFTRSEAEIAVMRSVKKALDPNNILNPGKIFDL